MPQVEPGVDRAIGILVSSFQKSLSAPIILWDDLPILNEAIERFLSTLVLT
jgi:hypothetical protein